MSALSDAPLSWQDRVFWELSRRYPTRPLVCAISLALDRVPDVSRLRSRVAALIDAHPRLRTRIDARGEVPYWTAAAFELDTHLLVEPRSCCTSAAERFAELATHMHAPLDPGRPPWQLRVVPVGDRHVLELRWHHALCDGQGMLGLLTALSDPAGEERSAEPEPNVLTQARPRRAASLRLAWWMLRARARERGVRRVGSGEFRALPIFASLDAELRARLCARHQVTSRELITALALAAVIRYERHRGVQPSSLRWLTPLGAREDPATLLLGNHSRALRLRIELQADATADALIERARDSIRASLRGGRATPYAVYRLLFSLPPQIGDRVLSAAAPFIVNFTPWSATPRSLAGAQIERIDAFTPMLPFQAFTFAVTSYCGALHAELVCDTQLLDDPELMVACVDEAVAELRDSAP